MTPEYPNNFNNQQPYNGQVPYNSNPAPVPGKGMATASLVLGILSFFCSGIILSILAIVFGSKAIAAGYTGSMAKAGRILGIIALVLNIIALIVIFATQVMIEPSTVTSYS